ncbi:serine hydrolase [Streptomyces sp. NPDC050738]|uniref:serine hydrolase n=1 Tax=Streptomyces sp. NPDC050738 TaxID=3154744 RepID=UPI00341594FD
MKSRIAVLLLLLLGVMVTAAALLPSSADHATASAAQSRPPKPPVPLPTPTPSATPVPSHTATPGAGPEETARSALDALGPYTGRYALAVEDLTSGRSFTHGAFTADFTCASIIKVDILAALLLQAQDRGDELTAEQRQLASAMIRLSDNDAGQELWIGIGRRQGLDAANARLGISAAHAGQRGAWGLTQTTAPDQIALLKSVFTAKSPLTAGSRSYMRSLMSDVIAGQNWGVGAASSPTVTPVLKNGWLSRETTKLWVVNSMGVVEYGGHSMLVVVLTDSQLTREAGISLIEQTATAAVHAMAG